MMANQNDIKKYLLDKKNAYFSQDSRNGEILMLSGVWGSGKTHFWKNKIEKELLEGLEKKEKSYVFVSLYGKDSIEELQNEIYQLSYNFAAGNKNDVISSAYSVFTKVSSFVPKISLFGIEVELDKTSEKIDAERTKEEIEKGISWLTNGGVVCFDDFERKSSKIDLNDLFGFITNLTEILKTKTIIITNQEFFKDKESEVFNRIKEKSVNKFLLFDPTVDELFETIYQDKYTTLDEYKSKILEAIKITEEKNARIFIQVLDNCLEYKNIAQNENEMYMLTIITILFVKYNIIFDMVNMEDFREIKFLPKILKEMPAKLQKEINLINRASSYENIGSKREFITKLKEKIYRGDEKKEEEIKEYHAYIESHEDLLYQIYNYIFKYKCFSRNDENLINRLNNFVESGILLDV
jgi:tRNA A37 threonylcarbamoyladenosine biosynthesis protein TsaE